MIRASAPPTPDMHDRGPAQSADDFQQLGRLLVARVAALLASEAKPFVAITFRKGEGVRLVGWDAQFRPNDLGGLHASRLARRVEPLAAAFLGLLAKRWPPAALPSEFGVLSDGAGLVFSPCSPSPAAAGWLEAHAAGRLHATPLLRSNRIGALALIQPGVAGLRTLH